MPERRLHRTLNRRKLSEITPIPWTYARDIPGSWGEAADAKATEGLGGNARASRAWKGASTPEIHIFPAIARFHARIGFFIFRRALMSLFDKFGRKITDLRISVTDRCNFRCVYCRSADPENYREHDEILSWAELERLARIFADLGIRKVRLTGGEPLVRDGLEKFITFLKTIGIEDLSMTTNGHLLATRCESLIAAGLHRINISLDSLDPIKFEKITRTRSYETVMHGIDKAQATRLAPVKVNAVLVRGFNEDEVEAFAAFARERGLIMRFIEFMPLDADRHWSRELMVAAAEVYQRIHSQWPLVNIPHETSETARKYRFADGAPGEIGLIAPVTQPFCGHCSRIRLTADGKLRTCLFSKDDRDLRSLLRANASDEQIVDWVKAAVKEKEEGHRINEPGFVPPSRTMVFIGG